ncbi:MAG: MATE family efflux transporter [Clostridia bacterium]|nr:MATE family efflux transporter [Clostridia bacterium]
MAVNKKKAYEIDMTNGPVMLPLIRFAMPLMLSGILQLMFNAADVIVVGRFAGDEALAAVGSTGSLTSLIVNLFMGLSIGANVVAARFYGAQDFRGMSQTVHTSMLLSLIFGVLLTIVGVIFAPTFLEWMGSPDDVIGLASIYLRIYFCGMLATMFYNFGAAILRSVGDTKRPLMYLTLAGVVNVVLNLIFVIVLRMSVAGVALATIISQFISAALVVICLIRTDGAIHFDIKKMRIHKEVLMNIVRVGLPAGLQSTMFAIANVVIQSAINAFGSVAVAANSAASNLDGFVYTSMNSISQATTSFTSQNFGAKKYDRIWIIFRVSMIVVSIVGLVLGIGVWAAGGTLLKMYTDSADVIAAGMVRLTWMCAPYVLCGIMEIIVGALRGIGYSVGPMIVSVFGACVFRLFWILVICKLPALSTTAGIYMSYPVSWVITEAAQFAIFVYGMKKIRRV